MSKAGPVRSVQGWLAVTPCLFSLYTIRIGAQAAQALFYASLIFIADTSTEEVALHLGSLLAASLAAAFLFSLPAGALVDRLGPQRGLMLGLSLRLAVTVLAFTGSGLLPAWTLIFAYSAASQVYTPAETALAGILRGGASLRNHSLLTILQYAGQAIGALLLAPAAYFIGGTSLMFAVSAVVFALLTLPTVGLIRRAGPATRSYATHVRGIIEGAKFLATHPPARDAVAVLAIKGIVGRGVLVAIPVFLAQGSAAGEEIGVLLALGAAGTGTGLLFGGAADTRRAVSFERIAMLGIGVAALGFAVLDVGIDAALASTRMATFNTEPTTHTIPLVALGLCAFIFGFSLSLALVGAKTVLTVTPGPELQGRVAAAHHLVIDAALVLPIVLAGAVASWVGPRPMIFGLGLAALALAGWLHRPAQLGSWKLPIREVTRVEEAP